VISKSKSSNNSFLFKNISRLSRLVILIKDPSVDSSSSVDNELMTLVVFAFSLLIGSELTPAFFS